MLDRAVDRGARMLVLAPALQGFMPSDEILDPLLATATRHNVPVYIHAGPHSASAPTQIALLAMRHSNARIILGHCGSTDYAWDMSVVLAMRLPNLWYELSFVRPWAAASYGGLTDESRLIFGTSSPRNDMAFELRQLQALWPVAEHPQTYGGNLQRLLDEVRA
jgi:predicted TIM-barrel fold metal-dependent hydrolase